MLDLLHILSTGNTQVSLFVPGNEILTTIARFLHVENINLKVGREYKKGCLSIHIMPFLSQDEYDQLLWCCDINFVRGEDSWVRAILAGKPFIWQPYFQQDESHIVKLNAFLDEYCQLLEVSASKALQQLNHAWIYPNPNDLAIYWVGYIQQLEVYKAHAQIYTKRLSEQDDLATKLVEFCNK